MKIKNKRLSENSFPSIGVMCRDGHESIDLVISSSFNDNTINYEENIESNMLHDK